MIISIYLSIYSCIESYHIIFWGIGKYRIAGYDIRYCIESWRTIRFTPLIIVLYAPPYWNAMILQSTSFLEARCALIGQLSSALWLDKSSSVRRKCYAPYHVVMPCLSSTRLKPTINEAFVAFSEDIINDYNGAYSLFRHCAVLCHVNITPYLCLWS